MRACIYYIQNHDIRQSPYFIYFPSKSLFSLTEENTRKTYILSADVVDTETGRPVIAVNEVDAAAVIVKSLKRCNEVFRLPVEQLHHQFPTPTVPVGEIKYPAVSSGVFDPRGSRQISMQAWLLGSLLAGIKGHRIFPFLPKVNIDREGLTAGDIVLALVSPQGPSASAGSIQRDCPLVL